MKLAPDLVAGSREFTADKIRKSCLPATLLTADCLPSFRVFKFPSFQVSASDSCSHGALLDFWPFNWRIKCSGEALATWNLEIGALWNPLAAWSLPSPPQKYAGIAWVGSALTKWLCVRAFKPYKCVFYECLEPMVNLSYQLGDRLGRHTEGKVEVRRKVSDQNNDYIYVT